MNTYGNNSFDSAVSLYGQRGANASLKRELEQALAASARRNDSSEYAYLAYLAMTEGRKLGGSTLEILMRVVLADLQR